LGVLLPVLLLAASMPARAAGTVAFTYDANGNLTSKTENGVVSNYVYDTRDLLAEVQRDGVLLESYQYDFAGRRVRKAGPDGIVRYVWDEDRILLETDDFGNTIAKYDYAGDRLVAARRVGSGARFYLFDGLGSVVNLIDADGLLAGRCRYDAWGQVRGEVALCSNPFLFTGYQRDDSTGLYYAKARFYEPELGRFLTEDPLDGVSDTPLSLHRYLYAHANPTVFVDPTGQSHWAGQRAALPAGRDRAVARARSRSRP
jgi:RHS repeat-associated protein